MMRSLGDLIRFSLRHWLWVALGSAAAMLAIAHAFETFGGLAPCILCLRQREGYWAAMTVAAIGLSLHFTPVKGRYDRLFAGLLAAVFLYETGVAIYHAGAEWKWWPGPAACAIKRGGVSAADMAVLLSGAKTKMPSCEEAAWRFLGLSMAGWNVLIALKLAFWSVVRAKGGAPNREAAA